MIVVILCFVVGWILMDCYLRWRRVSDALVGKPTKPSTPFYQGSMREKVLMGVLGLLVAFIVIAVCFAR